MKFIIKWGLLLIPALALAMPALAQTRDTRLSDSQEPGSVLVFPKFIKNGNVTTFGDGAVLPRTEIEIGLVCPPGITPTISVCFEHQTIKLRGHWVCPGSDDVTSKYVCPETNFNVWVSLNGKIAFTADGTPIGTGAAPTSQNTPHVPAAPCANGYLIVWVVDNADHPIKFDGLIGDAVLRGPNLVTGPATGLSTAVESYTAIPIQAHPALPTMAAITGNGLMFDGAPGHYQRVTGNNFFDVKFDNETVRTSGITPLNALSQTWLILLTLDVRSNRPNLPTFVDLDFYNESLSTTTGNVTNPLYEMNTSTGTHFICWGQFQLTALDSNLTQAFQGTRKGVGITSNAAKEAVFGVGDDPGPVTLLGLVQVFEGTNTPAAAGNRYQERSYVFSMYNDSRSVPTTFFPKGTGSGDD